jgi:hypothetical protein
LTRLDKITKKSVILTTLSVSPLFFLFVYFGDPGRGRAALVGAAVIAVCVTMFWDLRKHILFWLALIVVILGNAALVALVPWNSNEYPGIVLLPVALPDFALVFGAFKLIEKISVPKLIS